MRIVTRGDLDGLVSSLLLSEVEKVDDIALLHPQDISNNKFEVTSNDILANLPYDPRCGLWFDHHEHTTRPTNGKYRGRHALLPSAARAIYEHYGKERLARFRALVEETDRFDSAALTPDDVLDPKGVVLLGFLIDPRTGMGGDFRDFFKRLVLLMSQFEVLEVLKDPDLVLRTRYYKEQKELFRDVLLAHSHTDSNVVVTDLRGVERAPVGNRFLVYTIYPHCNVSVRVQWGPRKEFVALNIGHSIFDRTCSTDIGQLCKEYGGGGHFGAGGCTLSSATAEIEIHDILDRLVED